MSPPLVPPEDPDELYRPYRAPEYALLTNEQKWWVRRFIGEGQGWIHSVPEEEWPSWLWRLAMQPSHDRIFLSAAFECHNSFVNSFQNFAANNNTQIQRSPEEIEYWRTELEKWWGDNPDHGKGGWWYEQNFWDCEGPRASV